MPTGVSGRGSVQHRRRDHRRIASGRNLVRGSRESANTPRKDRKDGTPRKSSSKSQVAKSSTNPLLAASLAHLDTLNEKLWWSDYDGLRPRSQLGNLQTYRQYDVFAEKDNHDENEVVVQRRRTRDIYDCGRDQNQSCRQDEHRRTQRTRVPGEVYDRFRRQKRRVFSDSLLEEGKRENNDYKRNTKGGNGGEDCNPKSKQRERQFWIAAGVIALALVIAIPAGLLLSMKKSGNSDSNVSASRPANSNLDTISETSIPASAKGTILDPFTWYDTTNFNLTYSNDTVGQLSIMGLNATWDDTTRANDNVPALNETWQYGTIPIRGVNLGGWLSLEPLLTPSFFSGDKSHTNIVDEWTLTSSLGLTKALKMIEPHYSSFVTEADFAAIQAAGFDHVRIPFSYWIVTTYDGDPYLPQVSWRYLLRGIEYARKYGLRVNLDLHGAPGSQNGWNHSGRQGSIGWLNGTDGTLNGQRTLDIHSQLSTFFAQPRYKNIVTMYGLVNEPRMVALPTDVVLNWSSQAIKLIRSNNFTGILIFGDGFLGLGSWQGKLQNVDPQPNSLLLDVHQYVVFNTDQLALAHTDKINFACAGWAQQAGLSSNPATGFGPTMFGELSQADTDCAPNLNNVGQGNRWEGTLNTGIPATSVLTPTCPTKNSPQCVCDPANADPSTYSDAYKQWLKMFAEAQMHSFERGWGWFYWSWDTEAAVQWSYKKGLAAGILPSQVYAREFNCSQTVPDFAGMGLSESF